VFALAVAAAFLLFQTVERPLSFKPS